MYKFIELVKQTVINTICIERKKLNVMDLGIGIGIDLNIYAGAGVQKLICIDSSASNL